MNENLYEFTRDLLDGAGEDNELISSESSGCNTNGREEPENAVSGDQADDNTESEIIDESQIQDEPVNEQPDETVEELISEEAHVDSNPDDSEQEDVDNNSVCEPGIYNLFKSNEPDLIKDFRAEIVQSNEYQSRFKGAEWFNNAKSKVVTCVGVGGIGSYAAMLISRFSPRSMHVYDMDIVDSSNISGQFYKISDIGKSKVTCTRDNIHAFSAYNNVFVYDTNAVDVPFNNSDIFILGLDSMRARKDVITKIINENSNEDNLPWIIDGRLSMRTLQVFCFKVKSTNFGSYIHNFMFRDEDADEVVCSMKQTSFMANMIGSMISNLYMSICLREVSKFPYGVPFMIEYDCLTYQLKTYINGEAALRGIRG